MNLFDEMAQHAFRNLEVGDDPVFHRSYCHDVSGRSAQHLLGFIPYG